MTYAYTPAPNPMAVREQAFSTDPEIRFTPFTSCIGLLASHDDINQNDVTAIHLVMVSDDGTAFNNSAADNAVALLGAYKQVVVIGETHLWEHNLHGPYQYLLGRLNHPIVMQRGDGTYGGRIVAGQFQVYDNRQYVNVPEARIHIASAAADPSLSAEAASVLALRSAEWADVLYAAKQWEDELGDNVVINVQVWWVDMAPANTALGLDLNAMCIPGIVQVDGQTLTRAQAKLQDKLNPNALEFDMLVVLNSGTRWLTGTGTHAPQVPLGRFSLATTVMHELCHGLGFLGLCNAIRDLSPGPRTGEGIYSDPSLKELALAVAASTQPPVTVPNYFFPPDLTAGPLTPFAGLFTYADSTLIKGNAPDDYVAFTGAPGAIAAQDSTPDNPQPAIATVLTGNPFIPFTSCDHVIDNNCLMNSSTSGRYYARPDVTTLNLLRAIGWGV